jgi:hypothetical protein
MVQRNEHFIASRTSTGRRRTCTASNSSTKGNSMSWVLHIEFFDTDASSYIQRMKLPLKVRHSFHVDEKQILTVEHADGTTRFVPLANVKQYYECCAATRSNSESV